MAIESGVRGAVIEDNSFHRTYCAVSLENASEASVINNTISNAVFGINVIGGQDHTIVGNIISGTVWKGIGVEDLNIPVNDNLISDAWGVGIFPCHWGMMPANNSFSNLRGPGVLYQDSMILTGPQGFRAFSYDSADTVAGENINASVRIAAASPFYGSDLPGFPKTIDEVQALPFTVRLRLNGETLDRKHTILPLGDSAILKLTGTAKTEGSYDMKVEPWQCAIFDPASKMLRIPGLDLGRFFWLDLTLDDISSLTFSLHEFGVSGFVPEPATFDGSKNIIHVPRLDLGTPSTFWLDLKIIEVDPLKFQVVGLGEN